MGVPCLLLFQTPTYHSAPHIAFLHFLSCWVRRHTQIWVKSHLRILPNTSWALTQTRSHVRAISHSVFLSHKHACKCIHAVLTTSGLIISLFPSTGLALPPAFPTMVDNHVSHNSSMAYMGAMEPKPVYQPPQVTPSRYSPVPRHMLGEDDFTRLALHLFSAFTKALTISRWNKSTLSHKNQEYTYIMFYQDGSLQCFAHYPFTPSYLRQYSFFFFF